MRLFLDCEKADGSGHDFKKGSVKFEYKHSRLITRNVRSKKQRRLHPTRSWYFEYIRGHGGNKDYDHLILEGEAAVEGNSYLFLISLKELSNSFPTQNRLSVTLPLGEGKSRRLRKNSRFVWDHEVTKEELRARVDEYARNSEGAESSLRTGVLGKPDDSVMNTTKNAGMDRNSSEGPRSTGTESTPQLALPFER